MSTMRPDAGPELPLRERIAEHLRGEIVRGRIAAGERIREEDVAITFGVSRVPVREAIGRLEAEGFVTLTPRRGATVTIPSAEAGLELLQIRRALETMAAGLAADNYGGAVAGELLRLTGDARRQVDAGDVSRHPVDVDRFHELVAEGAGNRELAMLLATVRSKLRWIFSLDADDRASHSWSAHAAILAAIVAGDGPEARRSMEEHIAEDEALLRGHLARRGSIESRPH
jgi:DNA-binding GntR family transcriptional regulator